jgi:hypothetical protein
MPPFLVRLDNEFGVIAVEHHEIHLQVTSRQIRLADEACDWPAKYVSDSDTREALQIWMFAKAHRVPWQSLAVERGWARATAKRYKDRAIAEIVFGLMRDSIRVEESRR